MAKRESTTPFDEPALPPAEPEKRIRARGPIMDAEMKVMNAINRAISKLPTESAKVRVLRYMVAKLEFPLTDSAEECKK